MTHKNGQFCMVFVHYFSSYSSFSHLISVLLEQNGRDCSQANLLQFLFGFECLELILSFSFIEQLTRACKQTNTTCQAVGDNYNKNTKTCIKKTHTHIEINTHAHSSDLKNTLKRFWLPLVYYGKIIALYATQEIRTYLRRKLLIT